jgi:hypothetical protein
VFLVIRFGEEWAAIAENSKPAFYAYGGLIYLVSMFLGTFFNVAFYHQILRALAGDPVSLQDGLRFAVSRLRAIVMWSLLAGTVGLIIKAIEERLGWLGRWVMGLIGTVWSVAAVFAIPVIIRQDERNPLVVLRDSAVTLKRTWGESLAGFIGIQLMGAVFAVVSLAFVLVIVIGMLLLNQDWLLGIAIVFWLLSIFGAAIVISMATHVYRCALYVYASEGVVPGPYTSEMMNTGWKVKKA